MVICTYATNGGSRFSGRNFVSDSHSDNDEYCNQHSDCDEYLDADPDTYSIWKSHCDFSNYSRWKSNYQ